jgi:hypothetical protein
MDCIRPCENIITGEVATQAGTHKLRGKFNGNIFVIEKDFAIGQALDFDSSTLNESYCYTVEIIEPNGNVLPSKYTFKILPNYGD